MIQDEKGVAFIWDTGLSNVDHVGYIITEILFTCFNANNYFSKLNNLFQVRKETPDFLDSLVVWDPLGRKAV